MKVVASIGDRDPRHRTRLAIQGFDSNVMVSKEIETVNVARFVQAEV